MVQTSGRERWASGASFLTVGLLLGALLSWLWPIGTGGKMPIGGDVTQFSLGPMSVLAHALRTGRLPIWNELWGYGFPGVGESQMGVYYPVHWILYGFLSLEWAYTSSLVLHTLWGGLGAWFAARRFGISRMGSFLAGFSWATCGFFVIHLPHQWGYTAGSWMPWAWGLGWTVLQQSGGRKQPFLLAAVLTLQILPGHFQLAFCTQVGLLLLIVESMIEKVWRRAGGMSGVFQAFVALAGAFFLSGAQVWPTLRLARLAAQRRDFEYLSGFAASPLHLVTFLAPGLFEISPLWRPIVWDPFHTSPEEYLGYVGLIPLFLAITAITTCWKTSPTVRALTVVTLVTLVFALGPYFPGFRTLRLIPGFSFFRAPARWTLAVSLALCLLSGLGFDALSRLKSPRRMLLAFCVGVSIVIGLTVGAVELGVQASERKGLPEVESTFSRLLNALPWRETEVFRKIEVEATRPNTDRRVFESLARQGFDLKTMPRPVFNEWRKAIYQRELMGTGVLLGAIAAIAIVLGGRPRAALSAGLVVLTVLDMSFVGRIERIDLRPVKSIIDESALLARLNTGARSADTLRNMPMIVGANPVSSYRTLDLPALESLTKMALHVPASNTEVEPVMKALAATGSTARTFDPYEIMELERGKIRLTGLLDIVEDEFLARMLFGVDFVAQQGPRISEFRVWKPPVERAKAWLIPMTPEKLSAIESDWSGDPSEVLSILEGSQPLAFDRPSGELCVFRVHTEASAMILISQLADPEWQAVWRGLEGERVGTITRAFGRANQGAWQLVQVPGPGDWTLRISYRGRDVYVGLIISAISWLVFAGLYFGFGRKPRGA